MGSGRCNTPQELEEVRVKLNVPVANAMIDSGFKASEVYKCCTAAKWKPMKGDDAEFFLVLDKRIEKTVRRVWRKVWVDSNFGQKRSGGRGELLCSSGRTRR